MLDQSKSRFKKSKNYQKLAKKEAESQRNLKMRKRKSKMLISKRWKWRLEDRRKHLLHEKRVQTKILSRLCALRQKEKIFHSAWDLKATKIVILHKKATSTTILTIRICHPSPQA